MRSPPRMLDDETLAPELRHDLAQVSTAPEPYDVRAGERRLVAALGLAVTAAASAELAGASAETVAGGGQLASAAGTGVLASAAAKMSLGVVVAAAVVTGVLAWPSGPQRARVESPAKPVGSAPASATAPAPEPEPLPSDQAVTARTTTREIASGAPQGAAATSKPSADPALRREIEQLARIKRLLATEPAQAHRLAEAGHREFPSGMLREEREALAVLALLQLDRGPEAARRAGAFLARYPRSAHREPIERELRRARERDARRP